MIGGCPIENHDQSFAVSAVSIVLFNTSTFKLISLAYIDKLCNCIAFSNRVSPSDEKPIISIP